MKSIGIFGTSGFAREVADVAHALGYKPFFIARDTAEAHAGLAGERVVLEDELDLENGTAFAIGIGDNAVRAKVARRFMGKLRFPNLLHPSASFGRGQREMIAGRHGVVICAGVCLTNNIQVGDFCIFNLNATVGHDVVVGDFANIAPGVSVSGNVHIGAGCWIGTGAVIKEGTPTDKLFIGVDTMIAAGAVVLRPCEANAVYAGVPAKKIK